MSHIYTKIAKQNTKETLKVLSPAHSTSPIFSKPCINLGFRDRLRNSPTNNRLQPHWCPTFPQTRAQTAKTEEADSFDERYESRSFRLIHAPVTEVSVNVQRSDANKGQISEKCTFSTPPGGQLLYYLTTFRLKGANLRIHPRGITPWKRFFTNRRAK